MYDTKSLDFTKAPSSEQYKPVILPLLQNYLNEYTKTGYLKFEVYQNSPIYGRLPVTNARITICKALGEDIYVCGVVYTDINGETEPIALPTVSAELSQSPGSKITNAIYDVSVEALNFSRAEILNIPIFESITSIQSVLLSSLIEPFSQPNHNTEESRGENGGNHQQTY